MIIPYLSDPDFVTYAMGQLPKASGEIYAYTNSPKCSRCLSDLETALVQYRSDYVTVLAGFRLKYGRDAKAPVAVQGKTPLSTERTINPAEFKDLIRDLTSKHTWSSMSTKVNPDGTWQLTFS